MKKKILVITVLLFTFAFISIPVMGAATKIEGVTLTASTTTDANPGYPRLSRHNTILHIHGTSSGSCTLTIPGRPLPEGTWYSEWVTRNKMGVVLIASRVVLTFEGEGTTGTFEGIDQRTIITGTSPIIVDNMVLHGTGDFRGQTVKLSYEGPPPSDAEGYLILPKDTS